jgi:hypothetical protein
VYVTGTPENENGNSGLLLITENVIQKGTLSDKKKILVSTLHLAGNA